MTLSNPFVDLAIGLIAFFLVASLIVTALQEAIAQLLDLRAKNLRSMIGEMLGGKSSNEAQTNNFFDNPLIKAMNTRSEKIGPSYIPRDAFTAVVKEHYLPGQLGAAVITAARALPTGGLPIEKVLNTLATQSGDSLAAFDQAIGDWYDSVMDRLSGLYKRRAQITAAALGFVVACIGNLDTLKTGAFLANSPVGRAAIVDSVQKYQATLQQTDIGDPARREALHAEMSRILAVAALPVGWTTAQRNASLWDLLSELWRAPLPILGWALTALATTVGAAFWFDLLKRFVNIRAAGPSRSARPEPQTRA